MTLLTYLQIPVPTEDFVMLDGHKRRLPSQVFRNPLKLDSYNSNSPFLLAFHAVVPALGESLFLLGRLDGKVTDSHSSHLPVQVTNEHVMMRMTRSEDGGVQLSLQVLATNEVYVVQTELMVYESYAGPGQASGGRC